MSQVPDQVPAETLASFVRRLGKDLERQPLELSRREHLAELAGLVAAIGRESPYEVLGVAADASEEAIHAAYTRSARLAHPVHAARLEMGDGGALEALFERVTESYLVLSDPERRIRHDREVSSSSRRPHPASGTPRAPRLRPGPLPSSEERARELEELAEGLHLRALALVAEEEIHLAIEVLRQAVLVAPSRADFWALLGTLQAKNERWLTQAHHSFRRAVEIEPKEPAHRLRLAEVLERMGEPDAARHAAQQALVHDPENRRAKELLGRRK